MSDELKGLHDRLLERKPDEAKHDRDTCPFCAMESINAGREPGEEPEGGSMSDKTYTEDELADAVKKAVEEATASLQTQLTELESSLEKSEIDKAIAAATAEKDTEISELQAKLDAAVIEAKTATDAKTELETFLTAAAEEAATKAEIEARKTARSEEAKGLEIFDEEYLTDNAERFAAMSDEDWAKTVEDWKAVAGRSGDTIPDATRMTASRDDAANGVTKPGSSMLSEIPNLRRALVDPRVI